MSQGTVKNYIIRHLNKLVDCTEETDIIVDKLLKKGVFNQYITLEIMKEHTEENRKLSMYSIVANCGHGSLAKLCRCLMEVDLSNLVLLLDPSCSCFTETTDENKIGTDKDIILDNLEKLVHGTNDLDLVLYNLLKKEIFNSYIKSLIKDDNEKERKRKMYLMVARCGDWAISKLCECFDELGNNPLDWLLKQSDTLSENDISVKQATIRMDEDNIQKVYKMGSCPKGYFLIIHIKSIEGLEMQKGTEENVRQVTKLWRALGYEVIVKTDLTRRHFEYQIKAFSYMNELENVDSLGVFVMGHGCSAGGEGVTILASDHGTVNSEWIIEQFSSEKCPKLSGKPKMFFFEACSDTRNRTGLDSYIKMEDMRKPKATDVIVIYPCQAGQLPLKRLNLGAWLVKGFCQVFAEYANEEHLEAMLKKVSQWMREKCADGNGTQVLSFENRGFDRDLYFHPGLYDKTDAPQ